MNLRSKLLYLYVFFLIIYSAFTLLPAPPQIILEQYHISATQLRFVDITIIILLAAIWFIGLYGYDRLKTYAGLIKDSPDGRQVSKLCTGVFLLVLWLPISSVISAALKFFAMKHPGILPAVSVIDNYINLFFPLVGFAYISAGARGLSEIVGERPSYLAINILMIILIYIGLIYYRLVATTMHRGSVYHMNIWFILTTLVAPYIYMWFLGMLATYEIYRYRRKVEGVVYKDSWRLLAFGFAWLLVASISLQYLTTLTARLQHLSFFSLLVVVYGLLLILSIGFVLIAAGTRKLQKIEEV